MIPTLLLPDVVVSADAVCVGVAVGEVDEVAVSVIELVGSEEDVVVLLTVVVDFTVDEDVDIGLLLAAAEDEMKVVREDAPLFEALATPDVAEGAPDVVDSTQPKSFVKTLQPFAL
jgi:hypothetical protein